MEIIRGIYNVKERFTQCVMTLGNFDGLHLGHQSLIMRLKTMSNRLQLPSVVMIFEPQPTEFFSSTQAPARLTSFQEKCRLFKRFEIDYLLVIPFTQRFANLSAKDFVEQWLLKQLGVQHIVVGNDFYFGAKRQGNIFLLQQYAQQLHFQLDVLPPIMLPSGRISSTAIREALSQNNFVLANQMLGRRYAIWGRVIHGNALARQLGFPTANIRLNRNYPALQGVFLTRVTHIESGKQYIGIANIGTRPTINGKVAILEVNLFDFHDDIYGHYLDVTFIEKLRDEKKFASLDELKSQISEDVCIAKKISAKLADQ